MKAPGRRRRGASKIPAHNAHLSSPLRPLLARREGTGSGGGGGGGVSGDMGGRPMKKVFAMFDQGKTGFVECSKFVNILNTLGQAFDEDELKNRIAENDPNKEGKVDFEKFCAIVMPFLEEDDDEAMHEELKEAFRLYDKGGDGYITTQTLKEILRELDNKLSEEDLDGIIDEIDEDGSGTVDFDEFMEMMTGE